MYFISYIDCSFNLHSIISRTIDYFKSVSTDTCFVSREIFYDARKFYLRGCASETSR